MLKELSSARRHCGVLVSCAGGGPGPGSRTGGGPGPGSGRGLEWDVQRITVALHFAVCFLEMAYYRNLAGMR